jgi:NAD(P)-dependent dehydrogenase (short-subunit alcohol dehydrogenase family)
MTETTALVTGATAGIGFYVARALACSGARVFIAGREAVRGQAAVADMRAAAGHDRIDLLLSDAASVESNLALAQELRARVPRLDLLINNAGGMSGQRTQTAEGLEHTFALNFAGPAALTTALLPLVAASAQGHIICVVSSALFMWKQDPVHDVESHERYVGLEAYAHAKLLQLLFAASLHSCGLAPHVRVHAVNPGMAWTPGVRALTPDAVPQWRFIWPIVRWFQRRASAEQAARATLALAQAPAQPQPFAYFNELRECQLHAAWKDPQLLARVWALAESTQARVISRV